MAMTYKGGLRPASQSQQSWNGSTWNPPVVGPLTSLATIGSRQGIDPVASGRWDGRTFRLNPVLIVRETGACVPLAFDAFNPTKTWGLRYLGEPHGYGAQLQYHETIFTWNDLSALYARNKALADLESAPLDSLVELGELKETLEMLRHPLKDLRKFLLRNLYSRKGETARQYFQRLTTATSSTWLEYRYGVRPLISTIQDALKIYRDGLDKLLLNHIYSGYGKVKLSRGSKIVEDVYFASFVGKRQVVRSCYAEYTSKVYYKFDVIPTWYDRWGIDFWDLPNMAYQLTRLSFVWDWFIGIGDWIQALQYERNRQILGCYVSHKVVESTDQSLIPGTLIVQGQPTWPIIGAYDSTYSLKTEKLDRRVLPLQTEIILPSINPSALGLERILDSLALIWQNLPKRRIS